jgi:hypothetical protein
MRRTRRVRFFFDLPGASEDLRCCRDAAHRVGIKLLLERLTGRNGLVAGLTLQSSLGSRATDHQNCHHDLDYHDAFHHVSSASLYLMGTPCRVIK